MKRVATFCAALALAACDSPEATRTQGGGPGADKGNRSETVRMHEGSKPFHETPRLTGVQGPPLDGAQHAHSTSRP